jgi:hypothetical protein
MSGAGHRDSGLRAGAARPIGVMPHIHLSSARPRSGRHALTGARAAGRRASRSAVRPFTVLHEENAMTDDLLAGRRVLAIFGRKTGGWGPVATTTRAHTATKRSTPSSTHAKPETLGSDNPTRPTSSGKTPSSALNAPNDKPDSDRSCGDPPHGSSSELSYSSAPGSPASSSPPRRVNTARPGCHTQQAGCSRGISRDRHPLRARGWQARLLVHVHLRRGRTRQTHELPR